MSSQWSHRNLRDKMFKSRHIVVSTFPHILRLTYLFDFQFLPRFCLWQQTFSIIKPWKCHIIFDSNALTSTSSLFQSSSKELQPVHPKGNQSWIFTGRSDAEAETPILWPPDVNWLFWKNPDAGKDWRQEKGMTGDEMVGWHHQHNGHGFGWILGVGDGQGVLACCSPWSCKESGMTE